MISRDQARARPETEFSPKLTNVRSSILSSAETLVTPLAQQERFLLKFKIRLDITPFLALKVFPLQCQMLAHF